MTDGAFAVNCFVGTRGGVYAGCMTRLRALAMLFGLPFLAACFPLSLYYQEGTPVARIDADQTNCEIDALQKVPVDLRRRFISPIYDYKTICNAAGACSTYRVLISPGRWESYDANEALRAKVARQCMHAKGYERVQLPACSPAVIEATTITATRVQPPITNKSCAIRLKSGRYQIVTPQSAP